MPEFISYDKLSYVPKLLATTFGHPTKVRGKVEDLPKRCATLRASHRQRTTAQRLQRRGHEILHRNLSGCWCGEFRQWCCQPWVDVY